MTPVAAAVEAVRQRVVAACERSDRDPTTVRIVAATKTVDASRVRSAIEAGIAEIGENHVQEALLKHDELDNVVTWHLFGHLQSNKARVAAGIFDVVHSVDSERIARALATQRNPEGAPLALLLEVDYSGRSERTALADVEVIPLVRRLAGLPGIHVSGLMTIAPQGGADAARDSFRRLRELRDAVEFRTGWALPELSMGMSDDFEVAVEEGATMIRLGRALFGER